MIRNVVIMAGGSGERFWPLSRKNKPKQLLELTSSGKVMIAEAIDRVAPMIDYDNIYIITGEHLKKPIEDALPQLPKENIIAEPAKRNTAPCLALAAGILMDKNNGKNQSIAVLTADQIIEPEENFRNTISKALDYVEQHGVISTIGIVPDRPETGYGYIETGNKLNDDEIGIYDVVSFKEKPDEATAEQYLSSGKYLWNSGMFFYRLDTFIEEMRLNAPEIGNKIEELTESNPNIKYVFESLSGISIDYALMEKTKKAVVTEANFHWDDLGAFDALDRVNNKDEHGNIIKGNVVAIDCNDSIIINSSEKLTTAYGLSEAVLIQTEDAVMSCKKQDAQNVKKIVDSIKENGLEGYL
ncbi:MAG: mannose-1-phosphate guanylyltransferase [Ignavibacteriae bacterium]|nr:mannose-1-phosphate guanylyltransferase [Ignavibacteriota bacterium]MCB9222120.1 mannose-1-phosphate guanylyltransferase [Ignavibacteria bacterium]